VQRIPPSKHIIHAHTRTHTNASPYTASVQRIPPSKHIIHAHTRTPTPLLTQPLCNAFPLPNTSYTHTHAHQRLSLHSLRATHSPFQTHHTRTHMHTNASPYTASVQRIPPSKHIIHAHTRTPTPLLTQPPCDAFPLPKIHTRTHQRLTLHSPCAKRTSALAQYPPRPCTRTPGCPPRLG